MFEHCCDAWNYCLWKQQTERVKQCLVCVLCYSRKCFFYECSFIDVRRQRTDFRDRINFIRSGVWSQVLREKISCSNPLVPYRVWNNLSVFIFFIFSVIRIFIFLADTYLGQFWKPQKGFCCLLKRFFTNSLLNSCFVHFLDAIVSIFIAVI